MTTNWKSNGALLAALVAFAWSPSVVHAQDDDLGVTMRMVTEDAEMTDQVVQEIELPEASESMALPEQSAPVSETVREMATEARKQGRDVGQKISEQAREQRDALDLPSPASGRPDPLESVDEGLDQVGDGVNEGVDEVGDLVGDGSLGDTVDQVGDTVDDTVDQVGDTLGGGSSD